MGYSDGMTYGVQKKREWKPRFSVFWIASLIMTVACFGLAFYLKASQDDVTDARSAMIWGSIFFVVYVIFMLCEWQSKTNFDADS